MHSNKSRPSGPGLATSRPARGRWLCMFIHSSRPDLPERYASVSLHYILQQAFLPRLYDTRLHGRRPLALELPRQSESGMASGCHGAGPPLLVGPGASSGRNVSESGWQVLGPRFHSSCALPRGDAAFSLRWSVSLPVRAILWKRQHIALPCAEGGARKKRFATTAVRGGLPTAVPIAVWTRAPQRAICRFLVCIL